ncbi:aldehyde dehydrogenase family protein [Marinobacter sp.]|uniref:aldehyde dehydrogenase family protein n=1 Tax=Marinobacter sp. TaxID=50741 RepID=UPI001B6EC8CF|nr:aldehyde dehydrogenase family protein [Marinobacter sp.]MBQ0833987.1 aldehyde dehydrogenase family protein [Marinobacter sp.]
MQIASLAEVGVTNVSTTDKIDATFAALQRAQLARRDSFTFHARIAQLDQLRDSIKRHESEIIAACAADFKKPAPEVKLTELLPVLQELRHAKSHLRKWMRPKRVAASIGVWGTRSYVRPEPKGVCLIIAPWNYPLNLALGPLVSALAAGNGAIIKPSEMTPHTSKVIANIVAETFPPDLVSVIEGDAGVAQKLLALPFDHIFFTGSPVVGKVVMEAAAKNLSSVTLELGGKSPTIVGPDANIKRAARNIVWGKFANNGQTCIAPDHVFVHVNVMDQFNEALKREIERVYGKTPEAQKSTADYCRIVNRRHFQRLSNLIDDAKAKGAKIFEGGVTDAEENFIAPTLISNVSNDMEIAQEELFGPILPVIEYDDIDLVIKKINDKPKPLALYVFDKNKSFAKDIIDRTSSGAVGVNLTVVHFLHPGLPFGGVNNSGIGAAHGEYGFRSFSHYKALMEDRHSLIHLLFPPYTAWVRRLIDVAVRNLG